MIDPDLRHLIGPDEHLDQSHANLGQSLWELLSHFMRKSHLVNVYVAKLTSHHTKYRPIDLHVI